MVSPSFGGELSSIEHPQPSQTVINHQTIQNQQLHQPVQQIGIHPPQIETRIIESAVTELHSRSPHPFEQIQEQHLARRTTFSPVAHQYQQISPFQPDIRNGFQNKSKPQSVPYRHYQMQHKQEEKRIVRQNNHMGSFANTRVFSHPSNQNQKVLSNSNNKKSAKSGSPLKRPPVTFSYQNRFYHQFGHQQKSQVVEHIVEPPPINIEKREEPILQNKVWEERFSSVYQELSYFTHEFHYFSQEFNVLTRRLESATSEEEYEELKVNYGRLLERLSESQQKIIKVQGENRKFLEQQVSENDGEIRAKYELLEEDYINLGREFERFRQVFAKQKQLQEELSEKLMEVTENYQRLQKQYYASNNPNKQHDYFAQLKSYVEKLEEENEHLRKHQQNNSESPESIIDEKNKKIIENQESIIFNLQSQIRDLEEEKSRSHNSHAIQFNTSITRQSNQIVNNQRFKIEKLQLKIKELLQTVSQKDEECSICLDEANRLREIAQTQNKIIQNLQTQLLQLNNRFQQSQLPTQTQNLSLQLKRQIQEQTSTIERQSEEIYRYELEGKTWREKIAQLEILVGEKDKEIVKYVYEQQMMFKEKSELNERLEKIEEEKSQMKWGKETVGLKMQEEKLSSDFQEEIDRLTLQLKKKQQEKRLSEEKYLNLEENLQRTIMERESQIRLLKDKEKVILDEYEKKMVDKDGKIKTLQEDLKRKQKASLSRMSIPELPSPSHSVKNMSFSEVNEYKEAIGKNELEIRELKRLKEEKERKNQSYEKVISDLEEDIQNKNKEISNLKRKLTTSMNSESEIRNLSEALEKKNQELVELKKNNYEKSELLVQMESLKNQRKNLKETLKTKSKDYNSLKEKMFDVEEKMKGSSRLLLKQMDRQSEEFSMIQKSVRKKDTEISKLKQSVQLKDTNIQQLQYESEKLRSKLNTTERALQHQKEESEEKVSALEKRISELEQRTKSLDETQKLTKGKYQDEIQNLDVALKDKEDIVRKLEGEIKVLKNKLKNHDFKVQQYETEISQLSEKIKELELIRSDLQKQLNGLEESEKIDKNILYDQYQIRIAEMETDISIKQKKIKHLQSNIETLKLKAPSVTNEDDFINQQQIEVLRKKVAEYESRLSSQQNLFRNYKGKDYESGHVFEQKIIYDLKTENERLRGIIATKGQMNNINYGVEGEEVPQKYIHKRLQDFNKKLEDIIEENKQIQVNTTKQNKEEISFDGYESYERERYKLIGKHKREIGTLQQRLVDLQRYCATLESLQVPVIKEGKHFSKASVSDKCSEQLLFFKQKNKELEGRIDTHIKVNKELKERLETVMKSTSEANSIFYYKEQVNHMEGKLKDYEVKYQKVSQQNKSLQKQISKSQTAQSFELQYFELETKYQQQSRKVSQLTLHNANLQNDLNRLQSDIEMANQENQRIRKLQQQKITKDTSFESVIRELRQKNMEYENKLGKNNIRINYLQNEKERLNSIIQQKSEGEETQTTKLRAKISNLQQSYRKLEEEISKQQKNKIIALDKNEMLESKIKSLEAQIQRLIGVNEACMRKQQDSEMVGYTFEEQISKLKNEIKNFRTERQSYKLTISSLEMRLSQALNQSKQKQSEVDKLTILIENIKIDKESEGNQTKQRLAYIADIEDKIRKLKVENQQLKTSQGEYEIAIDKSNQQIDKLQFEIQRLEEEKLRIKFYVEQMEEEIRTHERWKNNLLYQLQYVRSTILEFDALVSEFVLEDIGENSPILASLRRTIEKGLEGCQEVAKHY